MVSVYLVASTKYYPRSGSNTITIWEYEYEGILQII